MNEGIDPAFIKPDEKVGVGDTKEGELIIEDGLIRPDPNSVGREEIKEGEIIITDKDTK